MVGGRERDGPRALLLLGFEGGVSRVLRIHSFLADLKHKED